jgi:hypothetical protein
MGVKEDWKLHAHHPSLGITWWRVTPRKIDVCTAPPLLLRRSPLTMSSGGHCMEKRVVVCVWGGGALQQRIPPTRPGKNTTVLVSMLGSHEIPAIALV